MKTTVIPEETKKELPFPKLMIANDGEIVLFTSLSEGTVIELGKNTQDKIGEFRRDWFCYLFVDFYGSITMSNL